VQERIDLTPFTGGKVLLRFEYVTDDAIHNDGFVVDDIAVPELGWSDDAETDGGWHAEGFRRTDNVLPQEFFVQIAEVDDSGAVSVRSLSLGPDRSGETVIETTGSSASETVVIVSPSTLGTHQPSWFTLSFQPVP
jgi:hypothetical protein